MVALLRPLTISSTLKISGYRCFNKVYVIGSQYIRCTKLDYLFICGAITKNKQRSNIILPCAILRSVVIKNRLPVYGSSDLKSKLVIFTFQNAF